MCHPLPFANICHMITFDDWGYWNDVLPFVYLEEITYCKYEQICQMDLWMISIMSMHSISYIPWILCISQAQAQLLSPLVRWLLPQLHSETREPGSIRWTFMLEDFGPELRVEKPGVFLGVNWVNIFQAERCWKSQKHEKEEGPEATMGNDE